MEDPRRPAFELLYTEDILDEYKEVLNRMKIRSVNVGDLIAAIRRGGSPVQSTRIEPVSPDPADDIFYVAARAGAAHAIVTSNPRHFPELKGLKILSPAQALDEI
jgi:predicted nucleic acid-binding protein